MSFEKNKKLARIFYEMSNIYKYKGAAERFRFLAYQKASKVISALPKDILFYTKNHSLNEINGIGEGIAEKIEEYITTGRIMKFEELKKNVPYQLLDMMEITGFGPQSLKRIHEELDIKTKEKVIAALQNGSIAKLKGFGETKVKKMLQGLKVHKTVEDRILLWDALEIGERILQRLKDMPEVKNVELAGSLRRKKETIGDIDILVSCDKKFRKKIINTFTEPFLAKQILAKGDTKASIILHDSERQADLRVVNEDEWGSALLYFTGSKEHNIHLRTIAKEEGYKISEYGVFKIANNKRIASKTEEEIYSTLDFQFIPPEIREDKGEIELSKKNKIPDLIQLKDIAGDMQMHSLYSDGLSSIADIVQHIKKNFSYEYIVITDHSKSSRIANGMDEKELFKQLKEIDFINKKLEKKFVKSGIEVDILADGKLDFSDEILALLDWVTAAIHSNFNRDNTDRIINACENPYVNCIAHPTGRLIGKREPYKIDIERIVEAAKFTKTSLEINAQPDRMDLNDTLAKYAIDKGVKLVISTDSHSLRDFNYMKLGVDIARRAWCIKDNVLNTKAWTEIEKFKSSKAKIALSVIP